MLNHGGKLREYASLYQRPLEEWVDLSTGVSLGHILSAISQRMYGIVCLKMTMV